MRPGRGSGHPLREGTSHARRYPAPVPPITPADLAKAAAGAARLLGRLLGGAR
ncbi:hypothetical protein KCH_78070 [Kitasatospora cheerisanensis KCTC 2395]|uniref:Uncharacterized protein n=1 Tax=Kitasatospora cheerisanensis KCTC 2395 TaxID=1348663 RepID=A0A066YG15_9ACTN|nr:hypothetical protein KCH_78070 [Kitasatospora cheerisanensis KCTC 2395]